MRLGLCPPVGSQCILHTRTHTVPLFARAAPLPRAAFFGGGSSSSFLCDPAVFFVGRTHHRSPGAQVIPRLVSDSSFAHRSSQPPPPRTTARQARKSAMTDGLKRALKQFGKSGSLKTPHLPSPISHLLHCPDPEVPGRGGIKSRQAVGLCLPPLWRRS